MIADQMARLGLDFGMEDLTPSPENDNSRPSKQYIQQDTCSKRSHNSSFQKELLSTSQDRLNEKEETEFEPNILTQLKHLHPVV